MEMWDETLEVLENTLPFFFSGTVMVLIGRYIVSYFCRCMGIVWELQKGSEEDGTEFSQRFCFGGNKESSQAKLFPRNRVL